MKRGSAARLKKSAFGTCRYSRTSPPKITSETKVLNIMLAFEDALKVGLAIDECVRTLNRYNRSTRQGKSAALNIAIHLNQGRISIHEGAV